MPMSFCQNKDVEINVKLQFYFNLIFTKIPVKVNSTFPEKLVCARTTWDINVCCSRTLTVKSIRT